MAFLKKLKNNKADGNALLTTLIVLILVILCGFSVDFVRYSYQKYIVASQLTFVSRVAARQGGVSSSPPRDWDTEFSYVTSSSLDNSIRRSMASAGITDYKIRVSGSELRAGSSSAQYNFGESFQLQITAKLPSAYIQRMLNRSEFTEISLIETVYSERWIRDGSLIN